MEDGERLKIESAEGPAKLNIRDDRFTIQPEEDAFSDTSEDVSKQALDEEPQMFNFEDNEPGDQFMPEPVVKKKQTLEDLVVNPDVE